MLCFSLWLENWGFWSRWTIQIWAVTYFTKRLMLRKWPKIWGVIYYCGCWLFMLLGTIWCLNIFVSVLFSSQQLLNWQWQTWSQISVMAKKDVLLGCFGVKSKEFKTCKKGTVKKSPTSSSITCLFLSKNHTEKKYLIQILYRNLLIFFSLLY